MPAPPSSWLTPLLPSKMLASALPVPLMLALPLRISRSTSPSVPARLKLIDDCTVSVPLEPAMLSSTKSPALSTT